MHKHAQQAGSRYLRLPFFSHYVISKAKCYRIKRCACVGGMREILGTGLMRVRKKLLNDSIFVSKKVGWSFCHVLAPKSMEHDEGRGGK